MHAASTVIGKSIKSIYPTVNDIIDNYIGILNNMLRPRESKSERTEFIIMWSDTLSALEADTWIPNYIVPLLDANNCISLDISDTRGFSQLLSDTFIQTFVSDLKDSIPDFELETSSETRPIELRTHEFLADEMTLRWMTTRQLQT